MSFRELGPAGYCRAILHVDTDDARHLVEACLLGFRIHIKIHASQQLLHIGAADYRVIPGDTPAADLLMSHVSVNFDRSGFQEDINVVFPIDRLRDLKADGVIGSISDFHYSFMGAAPIRALEPRARALAALLKKDRVDAVLLTPV